MDDIKFKALIGKAIKKTVKQGVPAINRQGGCFYELDGLSCPIGHMMPSKKVMIEANAFGDMCEIATAVDASQEDISLVSEDLYKWGIQFTDEQIGIMRDLQVIHDDFIHISGESFRDYFIRRAGEFYETL